MNAKATGQALYDATRDYQNFTRRARKAGGGELTPKLWQEWLAIVNRLHAASTEALRIVFAPAD